MLTGGAVDVGAVELDGVVLEGEDIVREDDDLVVAVGVQLDQVLADAELVRVHDVEEGLLAALRRQILPIEFRTHRAPHFAALHFG